MPKAAAERAAEDGCFSLCYYMPLSWRSPRLHFHLPSPGNPSCSPMPAVPNPLPSLQRSALSQQPLEHLPPPPHRTSQQGAFSKWRVWPDPSDCCPEKVALVSQLASHISLVSLWCTNTSTFTRRTSRALTPLTLYLTTAWPTTLFAMLFRAINNVFVSLNRATTHLHLWLGFI